MIDKCNSIKEFVKDESKMEEFEKRVDDDS